MNFDASCLLEKAKAKVWRGEDIRNLSPFLIVAPHCDDETLGCGGLLANASRTGCRGEIIVVTDGAASHPNSKLYSSDRLRRLREGECREAARRLGVPSSRVHFLRLPDGDVNRRGHLISASQRLVQLARRLSARSIFTTSPFDNHTDHRASYAISARAASRLQGVRLFTYQIWDWNNPDMRPVVSEQWSKFRLDITRDQNRKATAMQAHRSQLGEIVPDDPSGFALNVEDLGRLQSPFETFVEARI